jgi:hypothetical protein
VCVYIGILGLSSKILEYEDRGLHLCGFVVVVAAYNSRSQLLTYNLTDQN